VTTDASDYGIGGVLEQEHENGLRPVAFVSRKLEPAERNYPTHDRELLAIHNTIRELRCYLHGSKFTVRSDHHPLKYLDKQAHLSTRQIWWLDGLAEYDYHIEHIKGMWNIVSNALSRRADMAAKLYTGEDEDLFAISLPASRVIDIDLEVKKAIIKL
jgi:hypothetical protein